MILPVIHTIGSIEETSSKKICYQTKGMMKQFPAHESNVLIIFGWNLILSSIVFFLWIFCQALLLSKVISNPREPHNDKKLEETYNILQLYYCDLLSKFSVIIKWFVLYLLSPLRVARCSQEIKLTWDITAPGSSPWTLTPNKTVQGWIYWHILVGKETPLSSLGLCSFCTEQSSKFISKA
jgi:hypothetical protein